MIDSPDKRPQENKLTKKPYRSPRLEVYGDLSKITRHVGARGNIDAPPHPPNRTR